MRTKQKRRGSSLPEDIAEVGDRIEHWRQTRLKRAPMPGELWDAAASLARSHGVYPVAKALRVNYADLKLRAEQAPQTSPANRSEGGFVELSAAQLVGAHQATVGTVVELEARDGMRMAIRLGAGESVDLAGLVAAFRSRSA